MGRPNMKSLEDLTIDSLNDGAETIEDVVSFCTKTIIRDFPNCSHNFPDNEDLQLMKDIFSEWCEDQQFKYGEEL